ncbi:MAG: hypothetical protein SangKO_033530 [Sandaracinaceae bacterium]
MRSIGRLWASALIVVVGLGFDASAARGQHTEAAHDAETRAMFERGREAYAEGRYQDALELFESAYVRAPFPELLFNIGLLHHRLGHDRAALEAFEEYLERAGEGPDRDEVERRIRVLRIRLTEADAQAQAQEQATEPAREVASPAQPARSQPEIGWPLLAGGAALVLGGVVAVVIGATERAAVEGSSDGALEWTEALDRLAVADGLVVGGAIGLGVGAALGLVAIPFFQTDGDAQVTVSLRGPGLEIGGAF